MNTINNFLTFLQNNQVENEFFQELMEYEDIEDINEAYDIVTDVLSSSSDREEILTNGFLFFYKGNREQSVTNVNWEEINEIYINRNSSFQAEEIDIQITGNITSYAYFHNLNDLTIFKIDTKVSFLNKQYKVFKIDTKLNDVYAVLLNKKGITSKNKYVVISEKIIEPKANGNHEVYGILNNI